MNNANLIELDASVSDFQLQLRRQVEICEPAVIRNLEFAFDGGVRLLDDAFLSRFGNLEVVAHEEYGLALNAYGDFSSGRATLGRLSACVAGSIGDGWVTSNHNTPDAVLSAVAGDKVQSIVRDGGPVISRMFAASVGTKTHMHFDRDHRHVLFLQLVGRKRIVMAPPEAYVLLAPLANFSAMNFQFIPPGLREPLFRMCDARDATIEPGTALYIPPLYWHWIEYVDAGVSMNMRFGRSRASSDLATRLHQNFLVQAIGYEVAKQRGRHGELTRVLAEIEEAVSRQYPSPLVKYLCVDEVLRGCYTQMFGQPIETMVGQRAAERKSLERSIALGELYSQSGDAARAQFSHEPFAALRVRSKA